jgi:hypothetical protein
MSDGFTGAQAQDTRREYRLEGAEVELLAGLTGPADVPYDPRRQDQLNEFWAGLGRERGFRWTTVGDLTLTSDEQGGPVVSVSFTAEPEVATPAEVVDHEAEVWVRSYTTGNQVYADTGMVFVEALTAAFAAGRDHGFTMGSKAPQEPQREAGRAGDDDLNVAYREFAIFAAKYRPGCDSFVEGYDATADLEMIVRRARELVGDPPMLRPDSPAFAAAWVDQYRPKPEMVRDGVCEFRLIESGSRVAVPVEKVVQLEEIAGTTPGTIVYADEGSFSVAHPYPEVLAVVWPGARR